MAKKKILIGLLISALIVFAVSAIVVLRSQYVKKVVFADGEINQECELGETVELGEYKINCNGTSVSATDYSVVYPDGNEISGKRHVLSVAGQYTAKYSVVVDGKYYKEEQKFTVKNNLYSATGKKTSAFYGVQSQYEKGAKGLVVSLAPQEELKFNKIINIADNTKTDKLLSFYITPDQKGSFDAANLVVRLTDVHDASNYVDVTYRCLFATRQWAQYTTYTVAQSAGNVAVGGSHVNDIYGFPTYQTFTGLPNPKNGNVTPWNDQYNLMFDYQSRQVWTDHRPANETELAEGGNYIADLDDASIFARPWKGFTTGEVYVSIAANSYQSTTMHFVLTYLEGYDLSEVKFSDDTKPSVEIDLGGETTAPKGLVGQKYKLFAATAVDDYDGEIPVDVNVFRNYGTTGQVNVTNYDGYFTPTVVGTYVIEYSAKDRFGNKEVKTVSVRIEAKTDANSLKFTPVLSTTSGTSGTSIKAINDFEVQNAKGNVKISAKAILSESVSVDLDEDFCFVPLYSGNYNIELTVSDYVETVVKQVGQITVTANTKPVFAEDTVLVPYFIKGQKYSIDTQTGYDVSSGTPRGITAKTYIKQDNGSETLLNGSFQVTANSTVSIIYRLTTSSGTSEKTRTVKVVNALNGDGDLDVSKYFYVVKGNASVNVDSDKLYINANNASAIDFVSAVQCENFSIDFEWYTANNRFGETVILMTDSVDKDVAVRVSYKWIDGKLNMKVNDGAYVPLPSGNTAATNQFKLLYDNASKQIGPTSALMMDVNTAENGEQFNGFPSNKVYLTFEMNEVSGASQVILTKINNQSLFLFESPDFIAPEVFVKKSNGDVKLNATVKIYGARAYDVLSTEVTMTLSVLTPSKQVATAKDGTKLDKKTCSAANDYEILASEYGTYTVTYEIIDSVGNKTTYYYGFNVIDMESPKLVVNTSDASINYGEEIRIRDYSISDNYVGKDDIKVYVYVVSPKYVFEGVNGGTYTPKERGTYYVYYYCYDTNNNLTVAKYKVTVK